jgi:molybdopterin-guanine dinucleotide biosynthesis protein A
MLGGILLTGGTSSRMGRDKATLAIDGVTLAARSAELLEPLVALAVEVGDGVSRLSAIREVPAGAGPLSAILAGYAELRRLGLDRGAACLILACDLPWISASVLARLAAWPGDQSVLPIIDAKAQPLCARWSSQDLAAATAAFASGEQSLRRFPDRRRAILADEKIWGDESAAFTDVDSPEDLRRLNLLDHVQPGLGFNDLAQST